MDKFVTIEGAEVLYRSSRDELAAVQNDLTKKLDRKVDGARVSDDGKFLYLTSNNLDVAGPYGPFSGGGGGGGSDNNAKISAVVVGSVPTSISDTSECNVTINWSSTVDDIPTGVGVMTIKVNGALKKTANVNQGQFTEELSQYFNKGENTVRIAITDVYNNVRTIILNVSVISLSLESSFDGSAAYTGPISYSYVATGLGNKVAYFLVDNELIGTQVVTNSGRQYNYTIPAQSHGSHRLEVYFTAENDGVIVNSSHLYYDLICYEAGNDAPIISVPLSSYDVNQYTTKNFEYTVYTPGSQISQVQIYADDVLKSEVTVGQVSQEFSYRFDVYKDVVLKFVSGVTEKTVTIHVIESEIEIKPEDNNLVLYLTSVGRSNTETSTRDIWEYDNGEEVIRASMNNFDWEANGWKTDDRGYPVLRLQGNANVVIPYQPFKLPSDPTKAISKTGKTIEIEFSTSSVSNYDVPIITCFENNRGFQITAQEALLKSNGAEISTRFKENEHIRLTFVIDKATTPAGKPDRLIYCFTNGIISGITQYPDGDSFDQYAYIKIGSDKVTTDIYNIRIYDNNLTHYQVVNNWIADMQDSEEMLKQFARNNVFDKNNVISINTLPMDLPYFVFMGKELPTSKDSILLDGYFVDRIHPERNFTFTKAEVGCQGTSSMAYPIKNYKLKFKNAESWLDSNGRNLKESLYCINDEAIPTNKFVFKADYASSEGANNVELVRYYNDLCKDIYLTPPQRDPEHPDKPGDLRIRQGIDGFPMVVFQDRGDEGIRFIGKYNFNNDKGTPEVYGLKQNNTSGNKKDYSNTDQSWEMKDNTNLYCQWKQAATSGPELLRAKGGFEVRYIDKWQDFWDAYAKKHPSDEEHPDAAYQAYLDGIITDDIDLIDATHLINLQNWVISTDPEKATGEPITPITYEGVPYDTDTPEYRIAKFKDEVEEHFVLDDMIFYYIFTEFFLMIDSRVKNSFPTRFNSEGKWIWFPYDMDTAIGINNEGKLVYSYNLEDTDVEEDGHTGIFNGSDAVIWNNLRKAFSGEIKTMYNKLRKLQPSTSVSGTSLSYEEIENRFEKHQETWPAAIFNEDAYYKYVIPYMGGNPDLGIDSYDEALSMCLGAKIEQRKWWLYNRFRYLDSKYESGLATENQITFRAYKGGNIYITPYYDIYIKAKFGTSIEFFKRGHRGDETEVNVELEMGEDYKPHDTEVWINSADQIMALRGLPKLELDTLDISKAINLQELDLAATPEAPNYNLKGLTLSNNTLLKKLDVKYCPNLGTGTISYVDASGCTSLEEAYFNGTSITSITLPKGGLLKKITLPNTIKDLKIIGHQEITDLVVEGLEDGLQINTLRIENVNPYTWGVITQIMDKMPPAVGENKNNVRLVGFNYDFGTVADFKRFISDLDTFNGINDAGQTVVGAQVIGTAKIGTDENPGVLDYAYYKAVKDRYPNLEVLCNIEKTVTFYNYDNSLLKEVKGTSYTGEPLEDDVIYDLEDPYKQDTSDIHYRFDGWATELDGELVYETNVFSDVMTDLNLYAHYAEHPIYTVTFYNPDGTSLKDNEGHDVTVSRIEGFEEDIIIPNDIVLPTGEYPMIGWGIIQYGSDDIECESNLRVLHNINSNLTVYAILDWPLERIWVDSDSLKRNYYVTEYFNPEGLIIKGTKIIGENHHEDVVLTKYSYYSDIIRENQKTIEIVIDNNHRIDYNIRLAVSMEITKIPDKKFYFTGDRPIIAGSEVKITFVNENIDDEDERIFEEIKELPIDGLLVVVGENMEDTFTEAGDINVQYLYYNLYDSYQVFVIRTIDSENLDNNDWQTIYSVCESGDAEIYWHLGQEKLVHVNDVKEPGRPDIFSGKDVYFRIVAFDHNKDVESPNKHTITFGLSKAVINNDNIVEAGLLSVPLLASNEYSYNYSFGKGCRLRYVCDRYFEALPEDLKQYIKPVTKWQLESTLSEDPIATKNYYADTLLSEEVKVFVPSISEITGFGHSIPVQYPLDGSEADETEVDEHGNSKCKQFEYYKSCVPGASSAVSADVEELKKYGDTLPLSYNSWWLRSFNYCEVRTYAITNRNYLFMTISNLGRVKSDGGTNPGLFVPFFNV